MRYHTQRMTPVENYKYHEIHFRTVVTTVGLNTCLQVPLVSPNEVRVMSTLYCDYCRHVITTAHALSESTKS